MYGGRRISYLSENTRMKQDDKGLCSMIIKAMALFAALRNSQWHDCLHRLAIIPDGRGMQSMLAGLFCIGCSLAPAFASDLLAPGIYRLEAAAKLVVQPSPKHLQKHDVNTNLFEPAIPQAAKVRYAMVSRNEKSGLNKVVFLTDKNYRHDPNSASKLCVAYAFPNWNFHSESEPYCRTGISDSAFEATLTAAKNSFTVSWPAERTLVHQEQVPPTTAPRPGAGRACALGSCDEGDFGYTINHYRTTHYGDIFSLHSTRPYLDILFLKKEVPIYERASVESHRLTPQDVKFAAVTAVHPEWFEVDCVGQDGQVAHGWLSRVDVIDGKWVEQKAVTKTHFFRVAVAMDDPGEPDGAIRNLAIEVLDRKTKKRIQLILELASEAHTRSPEDALNIVDANFDGYPDISIFGQSGGAGPNNTDNFFLFNSKTGQFEFDEALSSLPQIEFHPRTKTIGSAERGGCCSHSAETYRYIKGKLTLVADWNERLAADGQWLETTTGKRRNGKMRRHTTREKVPKGR
jgi:hypothetical protein